MQKYCDFIMHFSATYKLLNEEKFTLSFIWLPEIFIQLLLNVHM